MDKHDVHSICPELRKFVIEVSRARLGISGDPIRLRNLKSGRNAAVLNNSAPKNDRFSLIIPYCEDTLQWDVMFICGRPELPPDFYFHGYNFMEDADSHSLREHVPSLAKWDHNDPEALLNVIREFLMVYKLSQLVMIPDDSRTGVELGMLLQSETAKDVEIMKQQDTVSVSVCLSSQIPRLADDNFKIVLSLVLHLRFDSRTQQSVKSYGTHQFWDADDNSKLPTYHQSRSDSLLVDFIAETKKEIEKIVTAKLTNIARRKQLIFQFYVTFKSSIVEYDAISFSFFVCNLCKENFSFFLRVDLPNNFPQEAPQYKLISNYCFKDAHNFDQPEWPINGVIYNQSLPPKLVVCNFYNRFLELFNNFKRNSIQHLEKNLCQLKM